MQKETSRKIGFICVTIITLLLFIALLKPTVTGFFFVPANISQIDVLITESRSLDVQLPRKLDYFAVSGEIIGDGDVFIYLSDGKVNLLVYSNAEKFRENKLTGFASMFADNGKIQAFNRECMETCSIQQQASDWKVLVYVEPGTKLKITEIIYK